MPDEVFPCRQHDLTSQTWSLSAYALTLACILAPWEAKAPWIEKVTCCAAASVVRSAAPISYAPFAGALGFQFAEISQALPSTEDVIEATSKIAHALWRYVSNECLPMLKDLWKQGDFQAMYDCVMTPHTQFSDVMEFTRLLDKAVGIANEHHVVAERTSDMVKLQELCSEVCAQYDQMKMFCAFQEAQLKQTPVAIDDVPLESQVVAV